VVIGTSVGTTGTALAVGSLPEFAPLKARVAEYCFNVPDQVCLGNMNNINLHVQMSCLTGRARAVVPGGAFHVDNSF
jgi:hypothetical protein